MVTHRHNDIMMVQTQELLIILINVGEVTIILEGIYICMIMRSNTLTNWYIEV